MQPEASVSPLRAIDLFCGAGGLSQGLRDAGVDVVYALDKDPDSCATYRLNHRGVRVDCASIDDLSVNEIAEAAGGTVDLIVGGPSCQSFSTAGRKNGWVRKGDPRNDLWKRMLAVVERLSPKAFLLENVPGMMYWKQGEFGATVLDEFEKLGYAVSQEIVLAADHGVPQRRRRLIIVGVRTDERFVFPAETHLGGWRRDTLDLWEEKRIQRGLLSHIKVWEAIGDLPPLLGDAPRPMVTDVARMTPYARELHREAALTDHEPLTTPAEHLALITHVPAGGTWRDIPAHLLPDRFRGMRRTDSTNLLGRLDPALPAYTITTQFNNVTTGCYTHPYEDRALSIREAARIQSFPDTYRFVGNISSKCRQVGNAVPPRLGHVLVAAIARHVLGDAGAELHPAPAPTRPAADLPVPPASSAATRQRMKNQKRSGTGPEVKLRRLLHARGLRYSIDQRPLRDLRTKADLVFRSAQVAVFVHGCFWHGCPDHSRATKSNTKWWADKIQANKDRDERTLEALDAAGWTVVVVWEHEDPESAAEHVAAIVSSRKIALQAA